MNLELWQDLVASHRESMELIVHATPEAAANDLDAMRVVVGPETMEQLHGQLRQLLGRLASKLGATMDSNDVKQVLFVLAIALDEKVQRRLAQDEAPRWPLLQRALFDVHDGGDLFYDLIDDRQARLDTPEVQLLLEVCYFCLSDGFVGRHSRNKPMIEEYKQRLAARIERPGAGNETELRTIAYMPTLGPSRIPLRWYGYGAGALLLVPLLLAWVW